MALYKNYRMKMRVENKEYVVPELTVEKLKQYADKFDSEYLERFEELEQYYLGNHDIFEREQLGAENNKIAMPFGSKIVQVHSGYLSGSPVRYTSENTKLYEEFTKIIKNNDDYSTIAGFDRDMCIFGVAYLLSYVDEFSEFKYTTLSPVNTFYVVSNDATEKPLYAVNMMESDDEEDGRTFRVYGINDIKTYEEKDGEFTLVLEEENPFGEVTVAQGKNNQEMMGAFERVKPIMDDFDNRMSDMSNDQEFGVNQLLVIKEGAKSHRDTGMSSGLGGFGDDDTPVVPVVDEFKPHLMFSDRKARVAQLPEGWDLRFEGKDNDNKGLLETLKFREHLIYDSALMPSNLNGESSEGANTSGDATVARYHQLELYLAIKEGLFKKSITMRNRLITNFIEFTAGGIGDDRNVEIIFTRNIPKSRSKDIDDASKLTGIVSQYHQLKMIGIENPDAELERIQAEKEKYGTDSYEKTLSYLTSKKEEQPVGA
jgi:SPP1 family phage portal protein